MSSRIDDLSEAFIKQELYLRNWSRRTVRTYRQAFSSFQQSQKEELWMPLKSHEVFRFSPYFIQLLGEGKGVIGRAMQVRKCGFGSRQRPIRPPKTFTAQ